jgi:serine/threonine-protein kinase
MTSNEEINRITKSLPPELIPTLTYRPDIQSTVSIDTEIKGFSEDSSQYSLPKLSIKNVDSKETQTNNDFHIEYAIGKGGLGQVDAAKQLCFGRRIAIKRVRSDRGNAFAEEQLRREAQLMGKLEHPAIPPVHLVGQDDNDQITLVMKFIEGCSWLEIINRDYKKVSPHKLPQWYIEKHLNYFLRIGEALEFAHQKSIIHRDIKPENVVVGSYGEVYLIDWGIAFHLDKNKTLNDHGYAGTPCYASPEMVTKKPMWDIRSDVYLMGATLFHIFSGNVPHRGKTVSDVFTKILDEPAPKLADSTPSGLREICSRAMAKDPHDRYTSVHGMLEDIRHFLSHGELTELYSRACKDFAQLKEVSKSKIVSDEIEVIGSRCRYRLEQINQSWPENHAAKEQLCQCLMILTDDAVNRKRLAAARALLKQYSDLVNQKTNQWIQDANDRIKQLAEQLVSRSDELGTGIQVILVEELAAQKKAYEDLLAAYMDMKNSQK